MKPFSSEWSISYRNQRSLSEEYDTEILSRVDVQPRNLRTGSFDNLTTMIWASKRLTSTLSVRRKFKRILATFKNLARSSMVSDEEIPVEKAESNEDVKNSSQCPQLLFDTLSSCLLCSENQMKSTSLKGAGFSSHNCLENSDSSHLPIRVERLTVSLNDISSYEVVDRLSPGSSDKHSGPTPDMSEPSQKDDPSGKDSWRKASASIGILNLPILPMFAWMRSWRTERSTVWRR